MVLFAVFSGYSGSAYAELKIGFVDVVKLSESAPQIRSAQTKMDAEFGSREKEIIALQREIEAMEGMPGVLDAAIHVNAAVLAGIAVDGGGGIRDLKLVPVRRDADAVARHDRDL